MTTVTSDLDEKLAKWRRVGETFIARSYGNMYLAASVNQAMFERVKGDDLEAHLSVCEVSYAAFKKMYDYYEDSCSICTGRIFAIPHAILDLAFTLIRLVVEPIFIGLLSIETGDSKYIEAAFVSVYRGFQRSLGIFISCFDHAYGSYLRGEAEYEIRKMQKISNEVCCKSSFVETVDIYGDEGMEEFHFEDKNRSTVVRAGLFHYWEAQTAIHKEQRRREPAENLDDPSLSLNPVS